VDAFTRDLELMEVIVAADAVVNARVDLEDAHDWLARAFSLTTLTGGHAAHVTGADTFPILPPPNKVGW
jgi:hypothetical protein